MVSTPNALLTPVVFLVFNRPKCTVLSLAAIRVARPARLYVVADGPRSDHPRDEALCAEVRSLVEQGVDWTCEVIREYSPDNLGLALRVSSGLDAVFARETEAIILEDDCVADPTFFPFCAELLERYRGEPKVGQISGVTFQGNGSDHAASYYFSRYPDCWGWATWRRAWRNYDHTMSAWRQAGTRDWLAAKISDPAEKRYWIHSFDATADGRMNSWAYRWILSLWQQDSVGITPYRNLVSNIGFGREATHTQGTSPLAALPVFPVSFPLVHPGTFACDAAADERTSRFCYRRPTWAARLRLRLRRVFFPRKGEA